MAEPEDPSKDVAATSDEQARKRADAIEQIRQLVVAAIIDKWKRGEPLPGATELKAQESAEKAPPLRKRRPRK